MFQSSPPRKKCFSHHLQDRRVLVVTSKIEMFTALRSRMEWTILSSQWRCKHLFPSSPQVVNGIILTTPTEENSRILRDFSTICGLSGESQIQYRDAYTWCFRIMYLGTYDFVVTGRSFLSSSLLSTLSSSLASSFCDWYHDLRHHPRGGLSPCLALTHSWMSNSQDFNKFAHNVQFVHIEL